jgi:NAD+ synthase (glutamine-hydrolysing)
MKDGFIKVAVGTPKVKVADCRFNAETTIAMMREAADLQVRLLVLPELGLTAYTCADLFLQDTLIRGAMQGLLSVVSASSDMEMVTVVGLPLVYQGKLYNCAAAVSQGKILGIVPKTHIPNYQEFYEARWFSRAPSQIGKITIGLMDIPFGSRILFTCDEFIDFRFAIEICEDLWVPNPPSTSHALAGAMIIANLSASDELVGKADYRRQLVSGQSARLVCAYLYADAGPGESSTDLVFVAHDLIAENGILLTERDSGETGLLVTEVDVSRLATERRKLTTFPACENEGYVDVHFSQKIAVTELSRTFSRFPFVPAQGLDRDSRCETILRLQALGLCKRLEHTALKSVVVGVSGGLDSTLALLVAVEAFERMGLSKEGIFAVTMPCFGTTDRTRDNARMLSNSLGVSFLSIDITKSVLQHFADIGHDASVHDVVFENSQARERTQVLMDLANRESALVVGTGDLSELALGWATYNGDHMSMYGVNASVPKTLIRHLVAFHARKQSDATLRKVLLDVLDTPVSPELLPAKDGRISQVTEDIVGPYELHDFFLYYAIRWAYGPSKIFRIACSTFDGAYDSITIMKWLKIFYGRFFSQQFKRSCLPDGPKVGSVVLSPRGDWRMPSDACVSLWKAELESL